MSVIPKIELAQAGLRPRDADTPFPRLCSHRGMNTLAPENSLPAFAQAIALGAQEIEMDLWPSKDGELVVCHDSTLERTTNARGSIPDMTWAEIRKADAGVRFSSEYAGLELPRFEDVLSCFAKRVIMNIHVKSLPGAGGYDEAAFRKIAALLEKYDCVEHAYIAGEADVLEVSRRLFPSLSRCCLDGKLDYALVETAARYGCQRLQLAKPFFTQAMIDRARELGMRVNLFWSDEPPEGAYFLGAGVDTLLTNRYLAMRNALCAR